MATNEWHWRAAIFATVLTMCTVATALIARTIYASRLAAADSHASSATRADSGSDPWTADQTVQPAELVKELSGSSSDRPIVACVGFKFLFDGGHIPGASFHGPGSKDEGIADLKKWAQSIPRSANVVLYCGCCPLERCPNLRPAFSTMRDMGFKRLRVLLLPQNFATDWVAKGYPIEKGN